jgi:hypothetical protein
MQTSRACTGRPSTFHLLSSTTHAMNAPTASGSDCSIFIADTFRWPYGSGTGSTTTAGCPLISGRSGSSAT